MMVKLSKFAQGLVEDVNREDSIVVEMAGKMVDLLFNVFLLAGIPFFLYVLLQFALLN